MMRRFLSLVAAIGVLSGPGLADEPEGLTVYSYLTPVFIQPVFDAFAAETGIPINVEYMTANQLLDQLVAERDDPKADVVFTMEAKRLAKLSDADVLAPVNSAVLEEAIAPKFRHPDGLWFGFTRWARTAVYSKYRTDPEDLKTYDDLTDDQWRGKVCVRTSNKIYVQSLLASMIAHEGERATRRFVRGLVENFAREPIDLDNAQIRGVADGICDVAIANSYYFGRMQRQARDPEVKRILDAVGMVFLEQDTRGVHVNISGFGMVKGTDQAAEAQRLMEYMVRPLAQRLYADGSMDYPILKTLKPQEGLTTFGHFAEDDLPIAELGKYYEMAEKISRKEGWLWK